jgi:hypothetical protein
MLIVRRRQGLSRRNALLTAITAPTLEQYTAVHAPLHVSLHALIHMPSVRASVDWGARASANLGI